MYRPNIRQSCCKLYTIKLDATAFRPDKAQRQALNKFNKFVLGTDQYEQVIALSSSGKRKSSVFDLDATLDLAIKADHQQEKAAFNHQFTISLEPSEFTREKFELYSTYQIGIHKDEPKDLKESGFKRFLCDTPIHPSSVTPPSMDSPTYGSFHQLYRLDGKLIALAVLDFLPGCVSSVYFAYDPAYSHLSLGRVSACREASLAKMSVSGTMPYAGQYYMGFYIPNCPKMKYKGDYSPSYLGDPYVASEDRWQPLEKFQGVWKGRKEAVEIGTAKQDYYVSFAAPESENSSASPAFKMKHTANQALPPGTLASSAFPGLFPLPEAQDLLKVLSQIKILSSRGVELLPQTHNLTTDKLTQFKEMIQTLGIDVMLRAIIDTQ